MNQRINHAITLCRIMGMAFFIGVFCCNAVTLAQVPASAVTRPIPDAQVEANILKALANASDLANQQITTTTVYGVVTLSGTVQTEAMRTEAETLTSRASGVQKVVDEMTLISDPANNVAPPAQTRGDVPQSDGTIAPAATAPNDPQTQLAQTSQNSDNTQPRNAAPNHANEPNYGPGAPEYRQPYGGRQVPPPDVYAHRKGYPRQQPGFSPGQDYSGGPQTYGGQPGGDMVTIPGGAMVRIRINQTLDSSRTQPGDTFDGIVVNDVVADGSVAIPRGATVQGTVVDARSSGALSGRGELSLQLTEVTLAGQSFPLATNVWNHHGGDKTTETVNKTVIGGGIGALFGAAVGGGAGAAIGAGVGGAMGLGSSASSGNGQVYVPSEGVLTFQLAQPATIATVSQQEMNRLAQGVPPGAQGAQLRRRVFYPYPVYGPVYYGYPPYPYRRYPYPY